MAVKQLTELKRCRRWSACCTPDNYRKLTIPVIDKVFLIPSGSLSPPLGAKLFSLTFITSNRFPDWSWWVAHGLWFLNLSRQREWKYPLPHILGQWLSVCVYVCVWTAACQYILTPMCRAAVFASGWVFTCTFTGPVQRCSVPWTCCQVGCCGSSK